MIERRGQQRNAEQICLGGQYPALQSIMAHRGSLRGVEIVALRHAVDGGDFIRHASAASVRQLLMRCSLMMTVLEPHCPWSQPFFVPVNARCSRNASSNVVRYRLRGIGADC